MPTVEALGGMVPHWVFLYHRLTTEGDRRVSMDEHEMASTGKILKDGVVTHVATLCIKSLSSVDSVDKFGPITVLGHRAPNV